MILRIARAIRREDQNGNVGQVRGVGTEITGVTHGLKSVTHFEYFPIFLYRADVVKFSFFCGAVGALKVIRTVL